MTPSIHQCPPPQVSLFALSFFKAPSEQIKRPCISSKYSPKGFWNHIQSLRAWSSQYRYLPSVSLQLPILLSTSQDPPPSRPPFHLLYPLGGCFEAFVFLLLSQQVSWPVPSPSITLSSDIPSQWGLPDHIIWTSKLWFSITGARCHSAPMYDIDHHLTVYTI